MRPTCDRRPCHSATVTKCLEVSNMYSRYEVMPHGADWIAADHVHNVVQCCGVNLEDCLLGL